MFAQYSLENMLQRGGAHLMYEKKKLICKKKSLRKKKELYDSVFRPLPGFGSGSSFRQLFVESRGKGIETTYYKYYANVEIQQGDTIWELASEYMDENYASRED